MTAERLVRIMAGFFVLLSLALGAPASLFYQSSYWLWFTAFVGLNLCQSGFTQFCPAEQFFCKLGLKKAGETNPDQSHPSLT